MKKKFSYKKILSKKKPEKKLLVSLKKKAGRARSGKITVRRRGGGAKRLYRRTNFGQEKTGIPAKIRALEYDPYRSAFIMLLEYEDGDRRYRIAPQGIKVGDKVVISEKTEIKPGNRMQLENVPVGTFVYNVELVPGKGGKLIRSAGNSAKVLAHDEKYVNLEMPSGEVRKILKKCFATIGTVSFPEHRFIHLGKAGRSRLKRKRPKVRGAAMGPIDHPHGGRGGGKRPIGLKRPKTPWGKPALGVKTRGKKQSDKLILKRKKRKKRK